MHTGPYLLAVTAVKFYSVLTVNIINKRERKTRDWETGHHACIV